MSLGRLFIVVAGIIAQVPPASAARIISQVSGNTSEVRTVRTADDRIRFELCRLEKPIGCSPFGRKTGYSKLELERRFEMLTKQVDDRNKISAGIFIVGYLAGGTIGIFRGAKAWRSSELKRAGKTVALWSVGGMAAGSIVGLSYRYFGSEERESLDTFSQTLEAQSRDGAVVTLDIPISEFVKSLNYALMIVD